MDSLSPAAIAVAAPSETRGPPRQVACLLPIWGRAYLRRFLTVALPTWLAPGNLPAIARMLPAEMVILTARGDEAYLRADAGFQRLTEVLPVKLHFIDHLITGNNYSTTITLAYAEAVRRAGPLMLDTCFVFLVSDYIVADGSLGHVISRMRDGRSAILAGNFQVVEEDAALWLRKRIEASPEALALSPRELLRWGFSHLHPATIANTVNFGVIENAHTNRLFWRVDGRTLIGRFFLMHMICIRPETMNFVVGSSCDYSFVPEMCPSDNVEIVTDSDDFLVIEMQPRSHESSSLRLGAYRVDRRIARSLSEWTTERHRRNASASVVFHADAIPDTLPAVVAEADAFLGRVRARMDPVPQPYRDHVYWKGAIASFREATGAGLTPDEQLFVLGYIRFDNGWTSSIRREAGRTLARLIGDPPRLTRWHPHFADYKDIVASLRGDTGPDSDASLLLVSQRATWITVGVPDGGQRIQRSSIKALLAQDNTPLAPPPRPFDKCLIELFDTEAVLAERIVARVEPLMRDGGTILVLMMIRNYTADLKALKLEFATRIARLMRPSARSLDFGFVAVNGLRWRALAQIARLVDLVHRRARIGYPVAMVAGLPLLVLACVGNLMTRGRQRQLPAKPISSALITIVVDGERARESREFAFNPPSNDRPL